MTNKFEQLIEYVINDEEAKAKELFHDIVVEKSREIYENLMNEEELDEAECDDEEESEEDLDESIGGDKADDLITDVETEEEGIHMEDEEEVEQDDEAEEDGEDLTHDIEHDEHEEHEDIEDRVIDLEDKIDELMAEFEAIMGAEDGIKSDLGGEEGEELGGDALEMDDTQAFASDDELSENVQLKAAPKPVTTEPAGTNTKSTTAFNSGAAGMASSPVKMTGDTAKGRPAPSTGNLPDAGNFKNVPGKDGSKLVPAPKPVTSQAAGVNNKTPFPKA